MATTKFTKYEGGGNLSVQTTIDESTGTTDAGKIPSTKADGTLGESLLPASVKPVAHAGVCQTTIPSPAFVTIGDGGNLEDSGNVSLSRKAEGFVITGGVADDPATYYLRGRMTGLTGLTAGKTYYLGAEDGGVTDTEPTTGVAQVVGIAVSATELDVQIGTAVLVG